MFTVSATGEKLKPLLIHKYQNPRPLYGIDKDTLAVHYYWNSTTWMQTSIFNHWLCKLNETMRKSRRNILLLVDNASSHKINDDTTLSNITVHFLPPNCTAHLQPCDAGIIYSFKSQYRKLYCIDRIQKYDNAIAQNQSLSAIPQTNIREAIEFIGIAWNQVTTETITHAWQKTGVLPNSIAVVETEEGVNLSTNTELIELVDQFPIDTQDVRMEVAEFVNLEDSVSVQDMPTTESIIAIIEGEELSESEDFPIEKSISHKSALEHVNSLLLYISQDCDNELDVDITFLSNLRKLKRIIETKHQNTLQQTSILSFYH